MNACVHNLNWTHFRALLRVPDENARMWYMNEAAQEGWSSRTLDRNISTQYYYRLMQSPKKDAVMNEMLQKTAENQRNKFELLKCPIVAEFLGFNDELKCKEGDNPTLGILLCAETDEDIARYSVLHDNDRLFMSKYLTYLPTKEQLKAEIERQKEIFYMQHPALSENDKEGMEE